MKLDKGVPIPKIYRGKWSFMLDMEVGDSCFFDEYSEFEKGRDAMRYYAGKHGWKVSTRKLADGSGWRVWRVK